MFILSGGLNPPPNPLHMPMHKLNFFYCLLQITADSIVQCELVMIGILFVSISLSSLFNHIRQLSVVIS